MRYLVFATIVAALWCFVGCRGSHKEGSREREFVTLGA